MKVPETGKIISLIQIGAVLIAIFLIYKIFTGLGLIKTAAKKKAKAEQTQAEIDLRAMPYFDPMYLKDDTSYKPLGSQAMYYTKELRKAMQGLGTNEEGIYNIFTKLPSKKTISEIAVYYKTEYKKELIVDLLNELTDKEQLVLVNIIKKLPA